MLVLCIACIAYEEFISSKLKWLYILGSCTHSIKLSKEINFVWILKQGVKNYLIFLNLIFLGRKICLCKHSCSIFDFVQCYSIWQLNKHIKLNWITQILKQYDEKLRLQDPEFLACFWVESLNLSENSF